MPNDDVAQSITVLGTFHQLQGPNFSGYVADPSYEELLEDLIQGGNIDFVFEEAGGRTLSIAEELAKKIGPNCYQDIDPPRADRPSYGIAEDTTTSQPINLWNKPPDFYSEEKIDEHRKREELWLTLVSQRSFKAGLLICGVAHCLSVGFRLQQAGYLVRAFNYIPHHKVCTAPHLQNT